MMDLLGRELDVIYTRPGGNGWAPVEKLARLAAQVLGGRLLLYADKMRGRLFGTRGYVRRRSDASGRVALVIAPAPGHLNSILQLKPLLSSYHKVAGWVIDSFWHDRIPRVARSGRFDYLYVTDESDVGAWCDICPFTSVSVLPWGADTLGLEVRQKTIDIQRLGRMPGPWDDDAFNEREAAHVGLCYDGRPPLSDNLFESDRNVMVALSRAKFAVAFSNLVSSADYTHPQRDYLTARWTDSLAHGAVVAGMPPHSTTARKLLWPGATLELDPDDVGLSMATLKNAVREWTPAAAEDNRLHARKTLDWRHRLATVASDLGLSASRLEQEIAVLHANKMC